MKKIRTDKKVSYLEKYYQWMQNGRMTHVGLCPEFDGDKDALYYDFRDASLFGEFFHPDIHENIIGGLYEFNGTRQNIVLFCAAMNNEL